MFHKKKVRLSSFKIIETGCTKACDISSQNKMSRLFHFLKIMSSTFVVFVPTQYILCFKEISRYVRILRQRILLLKSGPDRG